MRCSTVHWAVLAALGLMAATTNYAAAQSRLPSSHHAASVQTNLSSNGSIGNGGCVGQLLLDPGYEATDGGTFVNPNWSSTSTNFGTALCTVAACGGGTVHGGTFFTWLGGSNAAEDATISQTVVLTTPGPRYLNFFMLMGASAAPFNDVTLVKVDGTTVRTFNEPAAVDVAYVQRSVDISAFVNGASHTISFEYSHPGDSNFSNVFLDDVTIDCAQLPVTLQDYSVD